MYNMIELYYVKLDRSKKNLYFDGLSLVLQSRIIFVRLWLQLWLSMRLCFRRCGSCSYQIKDLIKSKSGNKSLKFVYSSCLGLKIAIMSNEGLKLFYPELNYFLRYVGARAVALSSSSIKMIRLLAASTQTPLNCFSPFGSVKQNKKYKN
jgi:hypothetical protein